MRKVLVAISVLALAAFGLAPAQGAPSLGSPIALKAWNELQKNSPKSFSKSPQNVTFIVAPNSDTKKVKVLENQVLFGLRYYEKYLLPSTPITIWIWDAVKDRAWYDAALRAGLSGGSYRSINLDNRADAAATGATQDGSQGVEFKEVLISTDQYPYYIYHEMTHVSQFSQTVGKTMPCWVREGMATYNGFAMVGRISQPVYINNMLRIVQRGLPVAAGDIDAKKTTAQFWIDYFVNNETRAISKCKEPQDYAVGAMAFQYLTGMYSFDKVYKFLASLAPAWKPECDTESQDIVPCATWKEVFVKVFGVTAEIAYQEFGKFIVDQIAWGKNLTIVSDDVLRKKYPQNFVVPQLPIPTPQIRAGTPCTKEGSITKVNSVQVTCKKISDFLFWSVNPISDSTLPQTSDYNSNGSNNSNSSKNPDEVFGPGGLCEVEGQYLPTEKGDVLLCTQNGSKLRWDATSEQLPTTISPGMKCENLDQTFLSANGNTLICATFKEKKIWLLKA
jgi:hypothetical protein